MSEILSGPMPSLRIPNSSKCRMSSKPRFHEVCTDAPWIYGVSVDALLAGDAFHPNAAGHRAYAAAAEESIQDLVAGGWPIASTGVPMNPAAASPEPWPAPSEDPGSVGRASLLAADQRPATACANIFEPGDSVRVTADGFASNANVTLDTDVAEPPITLGTAMADAAGSVDTVVSIPSTIQPAPATTPEQVVDSGTLMNVFVRGAGGDGGTHLALALVGLADQPINCDILAPTISVTSPVNGSTYAVGQQVSVAFTCADDTNGSGVSQCTADPPAGATLDTSLPGTYDFTVIASDNHGNTSTVTRQYNVVLPTRVTADAGGDHNLLVRADGGVWAWGANASGQLGDSSTTNRTTPVRVTGLNNAVMVAGGGTHSLAMDSSGQLWAWGANTSGQLGDGTNARKTSPVQVTGLSGVVWVAAGASHSVAVRSDATAWGWGSNSSGQLGDSSTTTRLMPVRVGTLANVKSVAAGTSHTLALRADGTVWAWGANASGQLGDSTTTNRNAPVQVNGLTGVIQIAADGANSYALKSDGSVWAWGANGSGQLGSPSFNGSRSSVPINVVITQAVFIAAGAEHALAIKSDGTAWAWGRNNRGQIGNGTGGTNNAKVVSPVRVGTLTGVRMISAGVGHSLATTTGDALWAWGYNASGQLGDGTTVQRLSPVSVVGLPP
jgi:alpha-tubulin suppressor-like RCC1 family protein